MANEKKIDYVILGLLSDEDLTGYEIKKRLDTTLSLFWGGSYGSIYPTLHQLYRDQLTTKIQTIEKGRNKNIYSITQKGREYLKDWLELPVEKDEIRYETLLKLFFGVSAGKEETLKHVEAFEEKVKEKIPYLQGSLSTLENIKKKDKAHTYYFLTAKFGWIVYQTYLQWCQEAKSILEEY